MGSCRQESIRRIVGMSFGQCHATGIVGALSSRQGTPLTSVPETRHSNMIRQCATAGSYTVRSTFHTAISRLTFVLRPCQFTPRNQLEAVVTTAGRRSTQHGEFCSQS
jgi:hypothetical protein